MRKFFIPLIAMMGIVLSADLDSSPAEGRWYTGVVQSSGRGFIVVRGPDRAVKVRYDDKTVIGVCITGQCEIDPVKGTIGWRVPLTAPDGLEKNDDVVRYDMTLPCWCRLMFKHTSQMKHMMRSSVDPKQFWWFDLSSSELEPVTPDRKKLTRVVDGSRVPYMQGRLSFTTNAGSTIRDTSFTLDVNGDRFNVMMDGSGRLLGVLKGEDIKPFCNIARVFGERKNNTIEAERIDVQWLGDFLSREKADLPRCLVIGDLISFDYNSALRKHLAGKVNLYHPPVDCGSVVNARKSLHEWLGAWDLKGHGWDLIVFNFGQSDTGITKKEYQKNLRAGIAMMKKTKAKLVWVTSTPIPDGCGKVGELKNGRVPGRKSGAVTKYLNPWAMEVIGADPSISICDLWEVVHGRRDDLYKKWWKGWDRRFEEDLAEPLGRRLAESILKNLEQPKKKTQ